MSGNSALTVALLLTLIACQSSDQDQFDVNQIAANQEVARYLQSFEGRGDLSDDSNPLSPEQALEAFKLPSDLSIELVLSEPEIHQPLELTFDHRGRLWVVQYQQYPYPEGLKVTGIDNHLRAEFDKVPEPPPSGVEGADRITFFEDTDGDGIYDRSTEAITGLNIATGVAFGRGRIWVLNPPYLLAYPDAEGDGLPDGPPEVHLSGFGLEDTHAVANSLRWGPDGWLYGASGSTVTSDISSEATKNLRFQGQGIWRYHPETRVFELFAEGGGNTFHVEMDAQGRIYSGDNGSSRGQYYKQGAYYTKNWGKHGALTNPYAFGYLPNMDLDGDQLRFTHAWIKYEGHQLPQEYQQKMFAINPLLNYIQLTDLISDGSGFRTKDIDRVVETEDHWFRPVDIKAGPDGAIYLADWYDSRLSHVDPKDTWHKSSGRIYRIKGSDYQAIPPFDLSTYSSQQLVELLSHPNKWHRQQALRQFGDRKSSEVSDQLVKLLQNEKGQLALEALWALNLSGSFDQELAHTGLNHSNPMVRLWTVRLLGDRGRIATELMPALLEMCRKERHPEVISQLACSARRLPPDQAIPLMEHLLAVPEVAQDRDNPLLLWWAVESQLDTGGDLVVELFENTATWELPVVQETILERLSQRMVMKGNQQSLAQCTRLLTLTPREDLVTPLLNGIREGIRSQSLSALPPELRDAMKPFMKHYGQAPLVFELQQGNEQAINRALRIIADPKADVNERLTYIEQMGTLEISTSLETLLNLVENQSERASIRQAAIQAASRFSNKEIGERIAGAYPDRLRADLSLRLAALNLFATRASWAQEFLKMIEQKKQVDPDDVPLQVIRQFELLEDPQVLTSVHRIWPEASATTSEDKNATMKRVRRVIGSGDGNAESGKVLYQQLCGTCHKLFDQGGDLGPDLTGYDRSNLNYLLINIVDPGIDIREGFVNYKIETNDGRILSGTIADRTSERVVLRSFNGEESVISAADIKQMEAQSTSIMPERLVDNLSDQQLRDLFEYIMNSDYDIN